MVVLICYLTMQGDDKIEEWSNPIDNERTIGYRIKERFLIYRSNNIPNNNKISFNYDGWWKIENVLSKFITEEIC